MKKYRKLIAAIMGVSALMALRYFDVQVLGLDSVVLDLIVSSLTAFGVYQAKNEVES
ncbi:hypothetical protein [Pseudohoeflea suaedae]|uniref:hypothetical protein n=1 Tax=Pseudohoeflea suaedae TaxID=877384 RepID=UPI001575786C|nr:hypothetical protein [Pseudohoeflea suaedae]